MSYLVSYLFLFLMNDDIPSANITLTRTIISLSIIVIDDDKSGLEKNYLTELPSLIVPLPPDEVDHSKV